MGSSQFSKEAAVIVQNAHLLEQLGGRGSGLARRLYEVCAAAAAERGATALKVITGLGNE